MQVVPERDEAFCFSEYLSITHQLAGHLDFDSAIGAVADRIRLLVPFDHMDVCIITPQGGFHSAYEQGISTSWGRDSNMSLEGSPLRRLLFGEKSEMLIEDATTDPEFHVPGCDNGPILLHGLRARIHVALRIHSQVIGCLSVSRHEAGVYGQKDLARLRIVAGLLAPYCFALRETAEAHRLALTEAQARAREEGLRLGALRLTDALEADRRRIAMDLHDYTLGDLTRIVRRIDMLSLEPSLSGEVLTTVGQSLRSTMDGLRDLIELARPSVLELFGLGDAVETHLERAISDCGENIAAEVGIDLPEDMSWLSLGARMALFRIAQEAINNAIRHGQPSRIWVQVRQRDGILSMVISDDGQGLRPENARAGHGLGNMRTRARLMGARFGFGREGERTVVRVERLVSEREDGDEDLDR